MTNLLRNGALILSIFCGVAAWSQTPKALVEHLDGEKRENRGPRPQERDALFDTEEHRLALNREFAPNRTPKEHLVFLKACAAVGIICGLELNSKMIKILDESSRKRHTLYSLFHDALGKEAQIRWIVPEYVRERQPHVLTIMPKQRPTKLDRTIVWNVARSEGANSDIYDLSKMVELAANPPKRAGGLFGSYSYEQRVHMPIRDILNHIAATNKTSWQVDYSSANATGKISTYPDKE
jgi:hypothetical protein